MAEIKTCEQYVLSRLQDLEQENDTLIINLDNLRNEYNALQDNFDSIREIIQKYITLNNFVSSTNENELRYYIKFEDVDGWRRETRDDFLKLVEEFGLATDEEEKDAIISNQI